MHAIDRKIKKLKSTSYSKEKVEIKSKQKSIKLIYETSEMIMKSIEQINKTKSSFLKQDQQK